MMGCLALAGALLSSCGVGMLVLDARSGVGGWDNVLWQVTGCVAGVSCFVALARSASHSDRPPAGVRAPVAAVLLPIPGWETPDFGIDDRPLVAEVIRFAAVIVVVTLVTWRSCGRKRDRGPTTLDLWVVLLPVLALTFCALCLGSLSAAVAIIVVTAVMLRVAGHRWGDALQPILVLAVFLVLLVLPRPHVRARVAYSVRETITVRLQSPERTFAGALMRPRDLGVHQPSLFDLPPRTARQLAIASIVGVGGYPGASAVAALFGVVGWLGFRCARGAAALKVRVMVAGMTATLVVPAALHMLGCLVFLSSNAGPLPFVSYGPGELVLAWTAMGFVVTGAFDGTGERQARSGREQSQPEQLPAAPARSECRPRTDPPQRRSGRRPGSALHSSWMPVSSKTTSRPSGVTASAIPRIGREVSRFSSIPAGRCDANPFPLTPAHVTVATHAPGMVGARHRGPPDAPGPGVASVDAGGPAPVFRRFLQRTRGASIPARLHFQLFQRVPAQDAFPLERSPRRPHLGGDPTLKNYPITVACFDGSHDSIVERAAQWVLARAAEQGNAEALSVPPTSFPYARIAQEISNYRHGARSLEKIVEQVRLSVRTGAFNRSDLPLRQQIDLHVNAEEFLEIVEND